MKAEHGNVAGCASFSTARDLPLKIMSAVESRMEKKLGAGICIYIIKTA